MDKVIYKSFSSYDFWKLLFLRGCVLVAAGYAFAHIAENPVIVSIFILLCFCMIIFFGNDQIIIYEDRIVQKDLSLGSYWFGFKGTTYYFSDINKAFLETARQDAFSAGVALAISFVLPGRRSRSDSYPIYFELKDGTTNSFSTSMDVSQRRKIVDEVNNQLRLRETKVKKRR